MHVVPAATRTPAAPVHSDSCLRGIAGVGLSVSHRVFAHWQVARARSSDSPTLFHPQPVTPTRTSANTPTMATQPTMAAPPKLPGLPGARPQRPQPVVGALPCTEHPRELRHNEKERNSDVVGSDGGFCALSERTGDDDEARGRQPERHGLLSPVTPRRRAVGDMLPEHRPLQGAPPAGRCATPGAKHMPVETVETVETVQSVETVGTVELAAAGHGEVDHDVAVKGGGRRYGVLFAVGVLGLCLLLVTLGIIIGADRSGSKE